MTIVATEEFKMTELGPLPCDWDVAKLRDLVKTVKGRKPTNLTEVATSTSPPYLTAKYFRTGQPTQFVGLSDDSSVIPVNRDDIVFIWDGSNAGDVFTGLAGILASTMVKVAPEGKRLYRKYLFYFLKTKFELFNSKTTGSTIPHVSKNLFYDLPVPLPPFPEQKKIAYVLSTVQNVVEKTEAVIKAARALKKSLMKHLFTYGLVSIDEAENVPLKETEIGLVPEEWEVKPLVDIATLQRGKDLPKQKQVWGKYPVIGSSGVMAYHNQAPCKGPGVVTGRSGSIGNLTYIEEDYWPHNTGLYVKDFHNNNPKFTYYLLYLVDFKKYATGVSVPTLNRNFVHAATLPVAPSEVQQHIADILTTVDRRIETEENKKKALEALFKTLLSKLMTGKIRVNNMEVPV